jgi:hypothetical protein
MRGLFASFVAVWCIVALVYLMFHAYTTYFKKPIPPPSIPVLPPIPSWFGACMRDAHKFSMVHLKDRSLLLFACEDCGRQESLTMEKVQRWNRMSKQASSI